MGSERWMQLGAGVLWFIHPCGLCAVLGILATFVLWVVSETAGVRFVSVFALRASSKCSVLCHCFTTA